MRFNGSRAKTAIIMLWIVIGLDAMMTISSFMTYNLLQDWEAGIITDISALEASDIREGIVGLLYTAAYIASAVTFIMWFRRSYFNLHQKHDNLSATEGWAAGAWFVPFLNLYRPYQIMKELYENRKATLERLAPNMEIKANLTVVGIWWAAWIISNVIANIELRISLNVETISEFGNLSLFAIASSIAGIVAGLLAIQVVKAASELESLEFDLEDPANKTGLADSLNDDTILDAGI